ncbi:MAG: hypothetical protein E6K70_04975 [Planctomycetota bacterium]|nr:MAG: hypothetical protein E6K70_04975 [Planctomycetota bacterium]
MIRVQCPKCDKKLALDDSKAGGVGACPACGQRFRVPGTRAQTPDTPNADKVRASGPARHANKATAKQRPAGKQTAPQQPPSRPKEPWEEEDSSPYAVREEPESDDRPKVEYGIDKDYEKKVERKRQEEQQKETRGFIGLIFLMIFIWILMGVMPFIMFELVWVSLSMGLLLTSAGGIMMTTAAFHEGKGLLMLFVPFYGFYFMIMYWKEARNGFCIWLIGCLILGTALVTGGFKKLMDLKEKQMSGPITPVVTRMV